MIHVIQPLKTTASAAVPTRQGMASDRERNLFVSLKLQHFPVSRMICGAGETKNTKHKTP